MPKAHFNVLKGHSREQLKRLIRETSDAMLHVLQAPRDRHEIWVTEIDPELWGIEGETAADVLRTRPLSEVEMPFVEMALMEGRPKEQHHAIIAEISEITARALGCTKDRIRVHIVDANPDRWGIGGIPASVRRAEELRARAQQAA
jgi:4-oxalocrotonate tautomerase family enzyme